MTLTIHKTYWRKACSCEVVHAFAWSEVEREEVKRNIYGNPPICPYCRTVFEERLVEPKDT